MNPTEFQALIAQQARITSMQTAQLERLVEEAARPDHPVRSFLLGFAGCAVVTALIAGAVLWL